MKLAYTKKELIAAGWATIGGRIEEYKNVLIERGDVEAYKAILSTYGESETDDVYRGLLVYIRWGTDGYYESKSLRELPN
jgi:hypothetical protein